MMSTTTTTLAKKNSKAAQLLFRGCCSVKRQHVRVRLVLLIAVAVAASTSTWWWWHWYGYGYGYGYAAGSYPTLRRSSSSNNSSSSPNYSYSPDQNPNTNKTALPLLSPLPFPLPTPIPIPIPIPIPVRHQQPQTASAYHNWELFSADFGQMLKNLKIFVYPANNNASASTSSSSFSNDDFHIFHPHPNPFNPKLGNYFSEHMFKIALLRTPSILTTRPQHAHFFFMPFSINSLRNHPRIHSEESIVEFVSQYTGRISREFPFWNASMGSDHLFVCCHSVGRNAVSKHFHLHNNAIQVACSSSYFQRLYVTHKDVALPQVWPRPPEKPLNPPHARSRLVFFAGRVQNSVIRQELIDVWENDNSLDIFSGSPPFPYEEGFRRSKYCLHVKGYEVNSARISDAMHYGCVPVIISNHYDLPFANVLDWSKFSIIMTHQDIASLKRILLSVPQDMYMSMYRNLCQVRTHFKWHTTPRGFDSFYMTVYQLWVRRGLRRLP